MMPATLLDRRCAGLRAEAAALWTAINNAPVGPAVQGAMRPFYERVWAIEDELAGKAPDTTDYSHYGISPQQMHEARPYFAQQTPSPWNGGYGLEGIFGGIL